MRRLGHLTWLRGAAWSTLPTRRLAGTRRRRSSSAVGEVATHPSLEHEVRLLNLADHLPYPLQRHDVLRRTMVNEKVSLLVNGVDLRVLRERLIYG